jgi:hypothetical protein
MKSFAYRKITTPRALMIDYEAPAICEGDFTSTGVSTISLLPILRELGPTGQVMEWAGSYWRLRWNTIFGALCYSIYRLDDSIAPFTDFILVAECVSDTFLDLDLLGDGTYKITVITQDGESEFSEIITTPGSTPPVVIPDPPPPAPDSDPVPCGALAFDVSVKPELGEKGAGDVGDPEIPADPLAMPPVVFVAGTPYFFSGVNENNAIQWPEFILDKSGLEVFYDPTPTSPLASKVTVVDQDLPPGTYHVRFRDGGSNISNCTFFPPPWEWNSSWRILNVLDDEHDGLITPAMGVVAESVVVSREIPPTATFRNDLGAAINECSDMVGDDFGTFPVAAMQNLYLRIWGDGFFAPDPYQRQEHRASADNEYHTNTGGNFRVAYYDWVDGGLGVDITMQMMQVGGLIQQARKLMVDDWLVVGPLLTSGISANWNGSFDTRDFYTATTLNWSKPSKSAFGGATIAYTQSHPTSPNGCGWILTIKLGVSSVWVGYKVVGARGDGNYDRVSGSGPDVLTVINKEITEYPALVASPPQGGVGTPPR